MNCNGSGERIYRCTSKVCFFIIVEMAGLWGDLRRDLGVCRCLLWDEERESRRAYVLTSQLTFW